MLKLKELANSIGNNEDTITVKIGNKINYPHYRISPVDIVLNYKKQIIPFHKSENNSDWMFNENNKLLNKKEQQSMQKMQKIIVNETLEWWG